jgi:hypothetical protein
MTTTLTPPPVRTSARGRPWTGGRIALVVIGAILVFLSLNTLMGAAILSSFDARHDDDGFFTARPGRFSTQTHAITSASLDLSAPGPDALYDQDLLGELRVTAASTTAEPLFIGIAPTAEVNGWLGRVAHEEIDETDMGLFGVVYRARPGGAPAGAPTAQPFWADSVSGSGQQTLTWPVRPGDWTVVLMNADGSAGVSADGTAGITLPILHTAIAVSWVSAGVLLLVGLVLIVVPVARRRSA